MTRAQHFAEYASYHADRRNRACHAVGIPLVVLGIMGLSSLVRFGSVDLAMILGIAVLVYYVRIDLKGALLCAVAFAALYAIALHLSWVSSLSAFVEGWIFQLVGHQFEGTKPKFLENAVSAHRSALHL